MQEPKVLVVATSRKTRGGISSVVLAHEQGRQWKDFHCRWIETHRDKSIIVKIWCFISSLITFIILLPQYDIVHIHLSEPLSALRKLPFMWLAKLFKKKVIVHFHSFSVETTLESKWKWVYQYLFGKADVVITLSEYWRKQVTEFMNDKTGKVRIVYNPCPNVQAPKDKRISAGFHTKLPQQHIILYAGTVTPRKGYADLIKAFAKIAMNHKEWIIAFAGNGEIDNAKALAERLGVSSQMKFLGWCSGADKEKVFREAEIFCLPSYAEGFPMSVLDAWAYGLPIITTPVGGIPDVAIDGENMLLFNPGDIDALSKCLEIMIADAPLRRKIVEASYRFASSEFNADTINGIIGLIYEELSK